jgi:hypothetical protein
VRLEIADSDAGPILHVWAFGTFFGAGRFSRSPILIAGPDGITYAPRLGGWSMAWDAILKIRLLHVVGYEFTPITSVTVEVDGSPYDITGPTNPFRADFAMMLSSTRSLAGGLSRVAREYTRDVPVEILKPTSWSWW